MKPCDLCGHDYAGRGNNHRPGSMNCVLKVLEHLQRITQEVCDRYPSKVDDQEMADFPELGELRKAAETASKALKFMSQRREAV